jgi:hypothetical protein
VVVGFVGGWIATRAREKKKKKKESLGFCFLLVMMQGD